ncbi:protein-disulfide reductase DsbD domain-containing protein [Pararhizobium mangrovi]|uniref:Thiol:disulfide interchange protein DsbD N-terminal domain-containing protein n=1 Tax=Pararhizobium mangrovi TaxID=2590452 RepID=A0A506U6I6_9HYPH|nr:protein-disulfide reductase DsbD domain-containing protein [Pararhizobium mangrovi]TPW28701.1 hypothetical protein FJU11_09000 [Pararhizobium mangrovi]
MCSIFRKTASYHAALGALACLFLSASAYAASDDPGASAWTESAGGRVRVIATPATNGTIHAAVEIALKPGWITYWRNPGEAGIPPEVETDGSINVAAASLAFPAPRRIEENGVAAIGYDSPVTLPLTIRQRTPGGVSVLAVRFLLGMCRDVCVPVSGTAHLNVEPAARAGSSRQALAIAKARAALPEEASADFAVEKIRAGDDGKSVVVEARLPEGGDAKAARLFLAGPEGWQFGLAGAPGSMSGGRVRFGVPVLNRPDGVRLAGTDLTAVVTAAGRSMETTVRAD